MRVSSRSILAGPVLAAATVTVLSGCAATGNTDTLQQQIQDLQATTQQALEASRAAEATATQNQAELAALKRDMLATRSLAEDANARVDQAFGDRQMK